MFDNLEKRPFLKNLASCVGVNIYKTICEAAGIYNFPYYTGGHDSLMTHLSLGHSRRTIPSNQR